MRTNNGKVKNVIISLYFILTVLAIILTTLISSFGEITDSPAVTITIILLIFAVLFVITHKISKFFEYDSDGVKVVITNRGMLLSEYVNYRQHVLEFEKNKLINFNFRNYYFYKSLTLTINDKYGHRIKETFNVTLVSRKKRRYIRQSLSKLIKQNKKLKENS